MALGLALTAMLAFGALSAGAAQASPTWHINGKAFTGKETFEAVGGQVAFDFPYGSQIQCVNQGSTGSIYGSDEGTALLHLVNCELANTVCGVAPLWLNARIDLAEAGGAVYQRLTPNSGEVFGELEFTGAECSIAGEPTVLTGSLGAAVGAEAVKSSLSFSAASEAATGSELLLAGYGALAATGGTSLQLTGANTGRKWGAY